MYSLRVWHHCTAHQVFFADVTLHRPDSLHGFPLTHALLGCFTGSKTTAISFMLNCFPFRHPFAQPRLPLHPFAPDPQVGLSPGVGNPNVDPQSGPRRCQKKEGGHQKKPGEPHHYSVASKKNQKKHGAADTTFHNVMMWRHVSHRPTPCVGRAWDP